MKQAAKWSKTIQHEWKLLESNLPGGLIITFAHENCEHLLFFCSIKMEFGIETIFFRLVVVNQLD